MRWIPGTYPIVDCVCEHLIRHNDGKAEVPLAMAIRLRHESPKPQLLNKPRAAALDEWCIHQVARRFSSLELIISQLACKADLTVKSESLMNMNPIEFANSFRDHDLHFLLACKLNKLP